MLTLKHNSQFIIDILLLEIQNSRRFLIDKEDTACCGWENREIFVMENRKIFML
jgi:hypothetical protein